MTRIFPEFRFVQNKSGFVAKVSIFSENNSCINPVKTGFCVIFLDMSSASAMKTPTSKSVTRYNRVTEAGLCAVWVTALNFDIAAMSGEVTILHFGFVLTTHSATRKLLGFWSKRLVVTGPILLPDLFVDLVEFLQRIEIILVSLQEVGIFQLHIIWVLKKGHGWIGIRKAKNESGIRA